MKNQLKSEDGIILVEVIVALIIITVAVVGLYMSSHYSRVISVRNYHYRSALLQATGELERIKMHKQWKSGSPDFSSKSIILDDYNGSPLIGKITYQSSINSDISVGLGVEYQKITAIATWRESKDNFTTNELGKQMQIKLREDYYYKRQDQ